MTIDLEVKPFRKTILQTSIILNVSKLTVRRMADRSDLEWSDGQITIVSIRKYLEKSNGKRKKEEPLVQTEKETAQTHSKPAGRRIISRGIID